jgi:hypothetical protein
LKGAHATIKSIRDDLAAMPGGSGHLPDTLAKWDDSLAGISNQAQQCVQEANGTLQKLRNNLNALGTAGCQAVFLGITTLIQQLKSYPFARNEPVWIALGHALLAPVDWRKNMSIFLDAHVRIHTLSWSAWAVVLAATAVGWLLGLPASRPLQRSARSVRGEESTYKFYQ